MASSVCSIHPASAHLPVLLMQGLFPTNKSGFLQIEMIMTSLKMHSLTHTRIRKHTPIIIHAHRGTPSKCFLSHFFSLTHIHLTEVFQTIHFNIYSSCQSLFWQGLGQKKRNNILLLHVMKLYSFKVAACYYCTQVYILFTVYCAHT